MGRGSIITLHSARDITCKREAGVTFMSMLPVLGTNGGNKRQVLGNLITEGEEAYTVVIP